MVLYELVRHKAYYAITFRDIPEEYILGGACIACGHTGAVNRYAIEGFWSRDADLRLVDDHLRCLACGNREHNTFMVYGRRVRKIEQKPMPETVEFGEPPPESSLRSLYANIAALHQGEQGNDGDQVEPDREAHGDFRQAAGIVSRAMNDNADGEEISDRND